MSAILFAHGAQNRCYLTIHRLASITGICARSASDLLAGLVRRGVLARRAAKDDPTIPKTDGWVYGLDLEVLLALGGDAAAASPIDASDPAHTCDADLAAHRPPSDPALHRPPCASAQDMQPLHPSRSSTYQEQERVGSVGRDATSRASAREPSLPTDNPPEPIFDLVHIAASPPAPNAHASHSRATLMQAIIDALPALDAQAMGAAMRQNWRHLEAILDCFGHDLEQATSWARYKAESLWQRLGERLRPHAPSKLLATDALDDATPWILGRHPAQTQHAPTPIRRATDPDPTPPNPSPDAPNQPPAWWQHITRRLHDLSHIEAAGLELDQAERFQLQIISNVLGTHAHLQTRGDTLHVTRGTLPAFILEEISLAASHWTRIVTCWCAHAHPQIAHVVWHPPRRE